MTTKQYSFEQLAASYVEGMERLVSTPSCHKELTCREWPIEDENYSYPQIDTGFEAFDMDFNLTFYQKL